MERTPALVLLLCLTLSGCVTSIKSTAGRNPPPVEPFSSFSHFEALPVRLEGVADSVPNQKILPRIQEGFDAQVLPILQVWERPDDKNERGLRIEASIVELKFVGGGTRFFAGALAGSSAVILRVKLVDMQTHQVIAAPEFYQRAAAMSGAWTIGAQDNAMLRRISAIFAEYLQANYQQAVGGPSGAESTQGPELQ